MKSRFAKFMKILRRLRRYLAMKQNEKSQKDRGQKNRNS